MNDNNKPPLSPLGRCVFDMMRNLNEVAAAQFEIDKISCIRARPSRAFGEALEAVENMEGGAA